MPFKRFELSAHRSYKGGIPKAHYSFFYASALHEREDHILLDILYEEHSYPEILEVPMKTQWLLTDEEDILVKVPSAESIAGDKLTAFALLLQAFFMARERKWISSNNFTM